MEQTGSTGPDAGTGISREKRLVEAFVQAAEEVFPQGSLIETEEDVFLLKLKDMELRILTGLHPPVATILARREEGRHLRRQSARGNRRQSEWRFSILGSCLKADMQFVESSGAKEVLLRCRKAMETYFTT